MSESELSLTSTPAGGTSTPATTVESLAKTVESLRMSLNIALLLITILAFSLFVFFLREVTLARRQTAELVRSVSEYQQNFQPRIEDFRTKLQVYAKTHPDFAPIYTRYFGATNFGASAPPPGRAVPLTNAAGARMPPPAGR